jgi:hypothetical protein
LISPAASEFSLPIRRRLFHLLRFGFAIAADICRHAMMLSMITPHTTPAALSPPRSRRRHIDTPSPSRIYAAASLSPPPPQAFTQLPRFVGWLILPLPPLRRHYCRRLIISITDSHLAFAAAFSPFRWLKPYADYALFSRHAIFSPMLFCQPSFSASISIDGCRS